ncbi:MAG: sporulation protein YqfD, partial [Clostridia bacterium]|nr:sporulation protein YqfD [Clostridia bacterium]
MRKNNRIKKGLNAKNISGVYVSFEVKGRNVERLMESLARQEITLYKIKKISAKKTLFSIKAADEQKFFAIINKVWYNTFSIKKLRYGGINYPFYFLIKNVGIAVGILLFTVVSAVSNDYIFSFEFTGSGSVYERAITYVLEQNGVKKFSRFSQINLSALEDILLAESEQLSFVSLKKSG